MPKQILDRVVADVPFVVDSEVDRRHYSDKV